MDTNSWQAMWLNNIIFSLWEALCYSRYKFMVYACYMNEEALLVAFINWWSSVAGTGAGDCGDVYFYLIMDILGFGFLVL